MTAATPRRAFLKGLAALPLIGGSVAILGQPTAVAEPVSRPLLAQYWNWLFYERRLLCVEMANGDDNVRHWLEHTHGGPVGALPLCGGVAMSEEIGWISSGSTMVAGAIPSSTFRMTCTGPTYLSHRLGLRS